MADEPMPIAPKAESIFIHTGNVGFTQKINQIPNIEAYENLNVCLKQTIDKSDRTDLQYVTSLICSDNKSIERVDNSDIERNDLKLTAKVFLATSSAESLQDALTHLQYELGPGYVDTLLISFPPETPESSQQNVWSKVEEAVNNSTVINAGVCDMDKAELEALFNWAKVKPTTDQVNLASCCVMPPDLIEYAAENDIQLLTHNDPSEILTNENLSQLISEQLTTRDAIGWNLQWVIRYTVLIKCRGIIKSKGYLMRALRDIRGKRAF